MQPPPRKVKVTQELKHTQAEQISRLHIKHQTECDLLEDLRTFSQKKAAVERDYAQALHKLSNQYLKREWPASQPEEPTDHRNMYMVWKAYLEGTVQVTQSRITACENYRNQVSDPAKTARLQKEHQLRKCIDQLTLVQAELQNSVKELAKTRKKYQETETMAQAVRDKAEQDAKSKLSLFQSRSSLQRASVKVLDGGIYEQVKDYLVSLSQTELEAYQAVHDTFNVVLESSNGVTQDFQRQQFVQQNPVFHSAPAILFQPSGTDKVGQLHKQSGTTEEHNLDKEARKWATRVAREHKSIIHSQRALEDYRTQQGPSEQNCSELELKMEAARENLRRAETVKLKAEARLALLRKAGITVETWLKSAMNQVMEELENERWANLNTHDPSLSGTADLEREEEELEDSGEVLDDSSSIPSCTLRNYPLTCKVLYSYKASQPDELTIEEQEVLEVIDDGDMEDWVKARNRTGQVGYVPQKYLQLPSSNSLLSMLQALAALDARSHSSSNSTEPELLESELPTLGTPSVNGDSSCVCFAKALYDYAGQTDEELSFPEGAIIRVLSRETHEDDGFWEGEFNGAVGVFPAVLVEDLLAEGGSSADVENGDSLGEASSSTPVSPSPLSERSPRSPFQLGPFHSSPLQTPTMPSPQSSPSSASASPIPRPPSYINGHHRPPPAPLKSPLQSPSQTSTQPPRHPADRGAGGTIRPVRAAPPPPKPQQPRGQVKRREEVEITLV
ncbi:F-BAR and double SH3 domains protein 2-like isoform X2 [Salvelinus fontinalis]|uniref:F-BAR and double SH3 domains protein 2-like isoform X2 n=1 Tax=Salvelinus fontinalis TaxID=8038 RepID=UPI0024861E6B|nr:F-BAR and double SH3 domains protein 2-like isoform X2 [Salvelinus fontinalis]